MMISDNYECPRCHNNFPSSNKILHDVRCTEEHPLSNNDKENFIVIKKENEENKKSDLNPVFVCDICHINMPQSEKYDHILCHNLDEREKKKEKKIKRIEEQKKIEEEIRKANEQKRIEEEIRKANEQKRKEKEIKKKKFIEQQKEIERQIQRDIRRKNTNPNPNQNNDRSDNNSNSNTNNNIVGGNIIRNIASGIKEVFSLFNNYDISLQSNNNNLNNNAHINHNNNNNNNNNNNPNINRRINNNNVHIRHRPVNINNINNPNPNHIHNRINDNLRNNVIHNHHINPFHNHIRIRKKHDHGTDTQIMNQLPEAFIEDVNKLDNEKKNCVICLEDFKTGDKTIILPCIHIFHNNCIKNWLKKQNSCPICKFKISSENMHS